MLMISKIKRFLTSVLRKISPAFHSRMLRKEKLLWSLPEVFLLKRPRTFVLHARDAGFFSLFFQVMGAIEFCQSEGHNLRVDFTDGFYLDSKKGGNWWQYYFETDQYSFTDVNAPHHLIDDDIVLKTFSIYGRNLATEVGHAIVSQIAIRPDITQYVGSFISQHFNEGHMIGVHYRGTDKVEGSTKESGRIPYGTFIEHLEQYPASSTIFVATDEELFLEEMKQQFKERVIFIDALRSMNDHPIFQSDEHSGYQKGKEALIECLLLSRCDILIRTDSNLSLACRYFSPNQKVLNLSNEK